jgi:quinol monooxygenase YgiN
MNSVKCGLLVRLYAKPGMEKALAEFLSSAIELANQESNTEHWFAIQFAPNAYGIFDTFPNNEGREAHLNGKIAAALSENSDRLLEKAPSIEPFEILVAKQ